MNKSRLKILHVTNSLNYGGLERVVIDICTHLDKSRFDPMVACISREGAQAEAARRSGIPVTTLKNGRGKLEDYTSFLALKRLIDENDIDVVHTHNTGPLLEVTLARLLSTKFPKIVHTDHTRPRWPDKKRYMLLERFASSFVSSFVAVSDEARDKLVEHEKIPTERIDIIDNGIDVEKYSRHIDAGEQVRAELEIEKGRRVIGLCVMHRKQKGICHLLAAMPEIVKAIPDVLCVIGGDGPERSALETQSRELGLENSVKFIGARSDVERVLSIFDVYVLPSEWEGLPLSLLEAMAARRCIVATSVGAVPKVLGGGDFGILIAPGDSMAIAQSVAQVIKDDETRIIYQQRSFQRVFEKYSSQSMVEKYAEKYVGK